MNVNQVNNANLNDASPTPALVIFGLDEGNKAHAAWFAAADAELAERAAGFMAMNVLRVATDEHRAAATGLPQGRVFASGKAFAPFCKRAAHDALAAFGEAFVPPMPVEPEAAPVPAVANVPGGQNDIRVGSLVLACEGPAEGWFEAIVVEDRGEGMFVLGWRDYPDAGQVVRRAEHLAFVPPCAVEVA
jgi:hypothetical protein